MAKVAVPEEYLLAAIGMLDDFIHYLEEGSLPQNIVANRPPDKIAQIQRIIKGIQKGEYIK